MDQARAWAQPGRVGDRLALRVVYPSREGGGLSRELGVPGLASRRRRDPAGYRRPRPTWSRWRARPRTRPSRRSSCRRSRRPALSVASVTGSDLPAGFVSAASFELLGRRGAGCGSRWIPPWAAASAAPRSRRAGWPPRSSRPSTRSSPEIVGEGLSAGPADAIDLDPAAELVLLRLTLRDPDGTEVALVTAVDAGGAGGAGDPRRRAPGAGTGHAARSVAPAPTPGTRAPSAADPGSVQAHAGASGAPRPSRRRLRDQEARTAATVRPFVLDELPPVVRWHRPPRTSSC